MMAIILVISFFITSSDSGSLVVDAFTSGGKLNSPVVQRVFWASMEGAVAAVLLVGGGLGALQTASITTGLPFAFLLLVMGYSLWKGLKEEYENETLKTKRIERESYQELIEELLNQEANRKASSQTSADSKPNKKGKDESYEITNH
jgi:choline/glycine/proline betaine transport protein